MTPQHRRYEKEWEGLRLVVEARPVDQARPEYWQVFVYDIQNCDVVHMAQRLRVDIAQIAAVEYAVFYRYGPDCDLNPESISKMLAWEGV